MLNSTFNSTCVVNGSVNEYACIIVCMHVFYLAPQSLVTAGCPTFVSAVKDSQTTPLCVVSVSWINILKGSLSAGFNDVPELIVKHCVQFITIPLVHIFHLSFSS